ncbi:indolepyruvate oxidoreductase subunit beta family protein [Ramlibacter sp. PS4R-6]|uniref:indolepyruvate oxidoreductase subunit beta family protein n=1 Tax=Ramlibacter sp. PS4R-6 TaxID=3133438 RepID=UPI003097F207
MNARPVSLLICALGGEGGGVLTEWLVNVARQAGYPAQATSIPGVAQRTGATTYYLEVFPVPIAELAGRKPVFSLNPVPGMLDAIVSSELLETTRQVANGMAAKDRTRIVTSSSRALTTHERMQLGDGRADSEALLKVVREFSREHRVFDMNAVAKECGTVVSAVMLGAVAGSGVFPFFAREDYENVIREGGGAAAQASLRGFAKAHAICHAGLDPVAPAADGPQPRVEPAVTAWPQPVAEFASLGVQRLTEYQDGAYAGLYEQRLRAVLDAEKSADPFDTKRFAVTRETARWLALWMAFDDIVRVADLKSRASRFERVRGETKAKADELLRIYDHFKPGAPEFAALLPPSLAKRVQRGTWSLPLKLGAHTVTGMLALRVLASLKGLRRKGSRYLLEQSMIEQWLAGVVAGTRRDWRLGHEIAQCGRLIKGYGSTNERGKDNLLHVLGHLAHDSDPLAAARAIADARSAALADDAGKALDAALVAHGAPPRPVKEQPIRWLPARRQA